MTRQAALSVVIVSYNTADVLRSCLESVVAACSPDDEVIIVDNASIDGSSEMVRISFPSARLVANEVNVGFAAAVNEGVRVASNGYTLILNPDTVVTAGALTELAEAIESRAGRAMVGPRLLNANGTVQRSAFRFPTPLVLLLEQLYLGPRLRWLNPTPGDGTESVETDWLKGACLLAPTALFRQYGPFDERFFMFVEDVDLCRRLWNDGIPVVYCRTASIVHLGGMSTRQAPRRMTLFFAESIYLFYRLHESAVRLFLATIVMRSVALLKAGLAGLRVVCAMTTRNLLEARVQQAAAVTFLRIVALRPPPSPPRPPITSAPKLDVAPKPARESDPTEPAAVGSLALLSSFALTAVLNYVFAIMMSWLLPVEQFGVLGVAQAILLLGATVIGAGFPWALAHLLARLTDLTERAAAFRSSLVGNIALGLIVASVVGMSGVLGVVHPPGLYGQVLVVAGITVAILSLNAVLAGTLQGLLRVREVALVRVAEVVVKVITGSLFVIAGTQATGAVLGFAAGASASTLLALLLLRDFHFGSGHGIGDPRIFTSAGPIFVGMFGLAVLSQSDILTLKIFTPAPLSEYLAGQYQVAATLARIPFFAGMALFGAVFPYVARTRGRTEMSNSYAHLALKYTFLFIVPVSVVLIVVPDPVIRAFFAEKYDQSVQALLWAAAGNLVLTLAYGVAVLLQAQGRPKLPAISMSIAIALQVACAAIAVPAMGMAGAAISLAFAASFTVVTLAPAVRRAYDLAVEVRAVVGYGVALATMIVTLIALPQGNRLETAFSLLAGAIVYIVSLVLTGLLTGRDIAIVGAAFGSRAAPFTSRLGRLIDSLRAFA